MLLLSQRWKEKRYSLILSYGLIISFSIVWFLLLLSYLFTISNIFLILLAWGVTFYTWYRVLSEGEAVKRDNLALTVTLTMTLLALLPALAYLGDIFSGWDAFVSWNRWALELYLNYYHPIDAAYPILLPAMWALFYKLQGSADIWWTAKLTLFVLPFLTLSITLLLYYETKKSAFLLFALLLYPYLIWARLYYGYMDMPVMLMGTLSLILLYAAESAKESREYTLYLYAAILTAALASIIKQAGLVFLLFVILYTFLHQERLKDSRKTFFIILFALSYFGTYLILYFLNADHSIAGNLSYLAKLSQQEASHAENSKEYYVYLWQLFFSYPPIPSWIYDIIEPLHLKPITPYLILFGTALFGLKELRRYRSVNFLAFCFFILGIAVWIHFFSYDARNSYWVKSFFILFFGINVGYLFDHFGVSFLKRILFFTLFLMIVLFLYILGDSFAHKQQKKYQYNVGDHRLAVFLKEKFEHKSQCFRVYTTDHMLRYNYLLNPYREQIFQLLDISDFPRFLEHNCSDGRVFIFRPQGKSRDEWDYIWKLALDKKWKAIDFNQSDDTIYFIPPHKKFTKNYFVTKTLLSHFPIEKSKEDITFSIDQFKKYKEGVSIRGWAFIKGEQIDKTRKYLILEHNKNSYIVDTIPWRRGDITKHFHAKDLSHAGFIAHIYFSDFPSGEYKLSLLLVDSDGSQHMVSCHAPLFIKGK